MKYYIADTHFYHANMIKYENRPFENASEMNQTVINNWNAKVKPEDEVYILGDFAFCSGEQANELLKLLNGRKTLIIGNHDRFVNEPKFDRSLLVKICNYLSIHDEQNHIILFHYPISVWDRKHHGSIHLYGHVHSDPNNFYPSLKTMENAYNVGVDVIGFAPMTLKEIIGRKASKNI